MKKTHNLHDKIFKKLIRNKVFAQSLTKYCNSTTATDYETYPR